MNNLTDAMNAKIKWYDANQEGRKEDYEKYKETYEKILEDFERYEELIDEEMPDLMDQIQ
jgi:multidrug resistance efflux pump